MQPENDNDRIDMYGRMLIALETLESCPAFAVLVPEVRSNMVFASTTATSREDVLAIDGRITVTEGKPRAAGRLRFGASSHMARLILEIRKRDPSVRAGIDFANTPALAAWLEEYCRKKGWVFAKIDRSGEPEEIRREEGASMPWKVAEAIRAAGGRVPKILYENGAIGKEPVSVILGEEPIGIAQELCAIAREYKGPTR
jgi:hydroxymethylpyrimidine/phosphomethylpyrimidine kinase